jgi:hypothetical protein
VKLADFFEADRTKANLGTLIAGPDAGVAVGFPLQDWV